MQELKTSGDKGGKYLTFLLGDEEYGIAILKIKEIIGMMPITYVPQTPEFVKGVINLRGKVIPVIDLRLKFGLESVGHTDRTCIIVVEIQGPAAMIQIGLVVDTVSEVLNIRADDIEDAPTFGARPTARRPLPPASRPGCEHQPLRDFFWLKSNAAARTPRPARENARRRIISLAFSPVRI